MSKILIVAEKNKQWQAYRKALFWDERKQTWEFKWHTVTITALSWHVLTFKEPKELVEWNRWALSAIPFDIKDIPMKVSEGNASIVKEIKEHFSKNYDFIINATDSDREWSFLFYELYDYLKCKTPVKRFYPNAMSDDFLQSNLISKFEDSSYDRRMWDAWYGRSYMDYQFGNNNTVLFTNKVGEFVKVWRVKLWVLSIIKKREQDIKDFWEARNYFQVEWFFKNNESSYFWTLTGPRIYDKKEFEVLFKKVESAKNNKFSVKTLKKERKSTPSPLPYTLVTLWKDCYSFFWWDADKTLKVLQTLYEGKLATYPRTKIAHLPETDKPSTKFNFSNISKAFWLNFTYVDPGKRVFDNSKVKEHSGIVPLLWGTSRSTIDALTTDQKSLYLLLVSRFFQTFSEDETYDSFIITTSDWNLEFKTQIKETVSEWWTKVKTNILDILKLKKSKQYDDEDPDEKNWKWLDKLSVGSQVNLTDIKEKIGKESPPPLLNDWTLMEACSSPKSFLADDEKNANLVKFMPTAGIGTVSTLWSIIKDMLENELIEKIKDKYHVTNKWNVLWDKLPESFKSILFTAKMEEQLDKIANWDIALPSFLDSIYKEITKDVEENKKNIIGNSSSQTSSQAVCLDVSCPKCNKWTLYKVLSSKTNKYYAVCSLSKKSGKWDCEYINEWDNTNNTLVDNSQWFSGTESKHSCPNCQKQLKENDRTLFCDCSFTLWKTVSGKKLTKWNIEELISNGRTKDKVTWLKSKAGKNFDAILTLDKKTWKVSFVF